MPLTNYGQKKDVPKNLKSAIRLLEKDCPSELKQKIQSTNTDSLKYLIYPLGGEYRTISDWTTDSLPRPKIIQYFQKKGITIPVDQEVAILIAFKSYLIDGEFDEDKVLKPIQIKEKKRNEEELIKYSSDSLDGIYIPKNLEDSFLQLNVIWKDSINLKIELLEKGMHFGLGMWLRNNWGLWQGSRLSKYFNDLGIYHADDMSGIILTSYQRHLKNEKIELDEQISISKNYWKEMKEKKLANEKANFEKYNIGDIVFYQYRHGFVSIEQETKYVDDICIAKAKILEKNEKYYSIKVEIIESCDKKGIIAYDNIDSLTFNETTKKYEKPKKRLIKKIKVGQEYWFNYSDWELND